jgi:hypothetical protein
MNIILALALIIPANNSSNVLFSASVAAAAAKEQEITRKNILNKISLATQWLAEQQRVINLLAN